MPRSFSHSFAFTDRARGVQLAGDKLRDRRRLWSRQQGDRRSPVDPPASRSNPRLLPTASSPSSPASTSQSRTRPISRASIEPLYWFGDEKSTSVDYRLSIRNAPVYSDGDRVVTITLKHYLWSNGQPVSARDVIFWINLLKANRDDWASYVPGGFPDNVTSATALSSTTVQLHLNAGYNPIWFTYNELSQITPLPLDWDRTSLAAPAPSQGASDLPDVTPSGRHPSTTFSTTRPRTSGSYASSPIWSVVDGPWKLVGLTTDGTATFVSNGRFRPEQATPGQVRRAFVHQRRSGVLRAARRLGSRRPWRGRLGRSDLGRVRSRQRLAQSGALKAQGYPLVDSYPFSSTTSTRTSTTRRSVRSCASSTSARRSSTSSTSRAGSTPTSAGLGFPPTDRCPRARPTRTRTRTPR